MSHAPERKEKNCLNCGVTVVGRFCHVCGQENIVPKESFGNLVMHFFYDITHFDGKFFHSLKYLLFKPGFLSTEYMNGRRASYLNPVRMYVFTSAIFFLIFFLLYDPQSSIKTNANIPLNKEERNEELTKYEERLQSNPTDTVLMKQIVVLKDTTKVLTALDLAKMDEDAVVMGFGGKNYLSIDEYKAAQRDLKPSQRDGWFKRTFITKQIQINARYRENPTTAIKDLLNGLLHNLPYLLFVSLPLFALILKLLYVRRKRFFYADHAIFSIHHYIFSFILLLIYFLFDAAKKSTGWQWLTVPGVILFILWPVYLFLEMRVFYRQGWGKTFVKFLLLNIMGLIILFLLTVIFFFLSVLQFN